MPPAVSPPILLISALLLLGGCWLPGPDFRRPTPEVEARWQAALPHEGSLVRLADWWTHFDDPLLPRLIARAEAGHPNLEKALASLAEARAGVASATATGLPVVNTGASLARGGEAGNSALPATTNRKVSLDASWELGLFGSVQRAMEVATAQMAAREESWHQARITLAAEVAARYVDYRSCRRLVGNLEEELTSRRTTREVVGKAVAAGLRAAAEAELARAVVAEGESQRTAQEMECELALKALVALSGLEETTLREWLAEPAPPLPAPERFAVTTLPAALPSQRPDLAAAEHELAAASAAIGYAEAQRYPRFSLTGSIGLRHADFKGQSPEFRPWSFGPSLSLPLFDAGARQAQVDAATARYQQALAAYRLAVRLAIREVEEALTRLDAATRRAGAAQTAADGQKAFFLATLEHYRQGGADLLRVEETRRNAGQAERNRLLLEREQVQQWIALYKALGGGWERRDDTP
ncbi:MAG: efflux transporter outer membrane subunit [Magnetococcales bacterium]|nr:efflux transporter outer membrane subunit [Magnetococcales bacterium]